MIEVSGKYQENKGPADQKKCRKIKKGPKLGSNECS